MTSISKRMLLALLIAAAPALARAAGPVGGTGGGTGGGLQAISKPSGDVTLNFTFSRTGGGSGRLDQMRIKEGDRVKAGDVVAELDDREEQAAVAQDKAQAEDMTSIEAQKAIKAQKEAEAKKIQKGFENGAVGIFELEEAKLNVLVEEARLKLTVFKHDMDVLKAKQMAIALAKMKLYTPIDGVVEMTAVRPGESVEAQTKVVRIINVDPLWVEVPVPYGQAVTLRKQQDGAVTFSDKTTATGKIIHIAALADPGSATLLVRLEVPNPNNKPAGDRVTVDFPPAKVAAPPAPPAAVEK